MDQSKILFIDVSSEDVQKVVGTFPKAKIENNIPKNSQLLSQYPDIEILCISHHSTVDRALIQGLKHLKLIVTRSVGFNHIDTVAAKENKICICNVPDYGAHVIAEHVFAMLLSMIRKIREADEEVEHYKFSDKGFRGMALKGKTLGIIGVGNIGHHVARIASMGFLMKVIAFDLYPNTDIALANHFQYVKSLDDIYSQSDVISLHVPLNKHTEHLINAEAISKMKKGVVILNASRGGVIDTQALVDGLESGKVSYAGLDVLEDEKHIKKFKELIDLPQVVTTPHIAYYADDSVSRMYSEAIESIERYIKGQDLPHQIIC